MREREDFHIDQSMRETRKEQKKKKGKKINSRKKRQEMSNPFMNKKRRP